MSFNSYKPFKKRNSFPKYLIVFIFGISFALFFSSALNIVTGIENVTQYIKQIILTSDGTAAGTTGVIIDGSNSKLGVTNICDLAGNNCKTVSNLATLGQLIFQSNGANVYYTGGNVGIGTDNPSQKLHVIGNILSSGIGINTNNPETALDVNGDFSVSGTGFISKLTIGATFKVPSISSAPLSSNNCDSAGVGAIKYEGSIMELCVCDGTNWKKVYSGSVLCIPGGGGGIPD